MAIRIDSFFIRIKPFPECPVFPGYKRARQKPELIRRKKLSYFLLIVKEFKEISEKTRNL
jgi:hypothetical protein